MTNKEEKFTAELRELLKRHNIKSQKSEHYDQDENYEGEDIVLRGDDFTLDIGDIAELCNE